MGTVVRLLAPGEHVDPNGNAIAADVVELSTGDRFLLFPDAFEPISGEAAAFVARMRVGLVELLAGAFQAAQGAKIDQQATFRILGALLGQQAQQLMAAAGEPVDPFQVDEKPE